jgi:hypothetical protein
MLKKCLLVTTIVLSTHLMASEVFEETPSGKIKVYFDNFSLLSFKGEPLYEDGLHHFTTQAGSLRVEISLQKSGAQAQQLISSFSLEPNKYKVVNINELASSFRRDRDSICVNARLVANDPKIQAGSPSMAVSPGVKPGSLVTFCLNKVDSNSYELGSQVTPNYYGLLTYN